MRLLGEVKKSLPASWYFDEAQFSRELDAIWYRDWVCVGRLEQLERVGDFFVASIGEQRIIITRAEDGELRAFHNTCRHRGALLCREDNGRFKNGRIICPYHTWTYSMEGQLLATPGRFETDDFDATEYSLYAVNIDTWGGFIFVNLAAAPKNDLRGFLGREAENLENWPLEHMRSIHQETVSVVCNWKIFWENYCECYHCPRVHPELCKVMPVYRNAVFDHMDVPGWVPAYDGDTGMGTVGADAKTWTLSGQSSLPDLPGPTEEDREKGVMFASITGSMFVVAHPDYVRSVRIVPTGPESIDLVVDWLLPKDFKNASKKQIEEIVGLARIVVKQDSEVCELNQAGLRSNRHTAGMLVAQEFELWHFHEWIRKRLADAGYVVS